MTRPAVSAIRSEDFAAPLRPGCERRGRSAARSRVRIPMMSTTTISSDQGEAALVPPRGNPTPPEGIGMRADHA